MEPNYDREYRIVKLVAASQLLIAAGLLVLAEVLRSGRTGTVLKALLAGSDLIIVRSLFLTFALLMILLAWGMKRTIRNPAEGIMLSFLRSLIRQIHRRNRSTAVALLIPPSALCEMCAVLGFILFVLGGGDRQDLYPLLLAGIVGMLLFYPADSELENLIRLDKETR